MSKIYKITNIHLEGNEHGTLRPNTIYAQLIDDETGEVSISATLEYILIAIRDRQLNVKNTQVSWKEARGANCSTVGIKIS